jgi:hypothetical protein
VKRKTLGIPFQTIPQTIKKLGIPFPTIPRKTKNVRNFVPTGSQPYKDKEKHIFSRNQRSALSERAPGGGYTTCCAEGILVAKRQFFFGVFEQLESLLRYEFYVGFVNCILSFSYSNRLYEIAPRLTL